MISALRWLIADTFRQSLWTGVFWLMLGASGLCMVFGLSVGFTSLGASEDRIRGVQFALAGPGAATAGLLLTLAFTAGFLPAFAEPSSALILLAKPTPRWLLFLGKFLGVQVLFAAQAAVFVLGTWTAIGLSTGYWPLAYLATLPLLVLNFAAFFSFSALLAVTTGNSVASAFGAIVFWLLCLMTNVGRHALIAFDLEHFSTLSRLASEGCYWLLPKPVDMLAVLHDALLRQPLADRFDDFGRVQAAGAFRPALSLAASVLFPVVMVILSAYELETADY
jgi:hypothetical protein